MLSNLSLQKYPYKRYYREPTSPFNLNLDSQVVLASTEIFRDDVWVSGPDFPMPIYAANVEQYDSDTIIVIGGASQIGGITSNKIYSFSRSTPGYSYITLVIIGHISLVGQSFGSSGFKILNQLKI